MNRIFADGPKLLATLLLGGMSFIAATGSIPGHTQMAPLPDPYWAAVEDAQTPEASEVFRNLTPITRQNPQLTWDADNRVLMVTWTTWPALLALDLPNPLNLSGDLWVTAVPDLQNFCQHYRPTLETPLANRLNQLLGLPLDSAERAAKRRMVLLWVDPQYLFRPSFDPEVTDHEAELRFRDANEFILVSPSYVQWFQQQYDRSFKRAGAIMTRTNWAATQATPYPWTQLGYTYDWGNPGDWAGLDPNRPKRVGLSEFVIRERSPISVQSVQSAEQYCQQAANPSN